MVCVCVAEVAPGGSLVQPLPIQLGVAMGQCAVDVASHTGHGQRTTWIWLVMGVEEEALVVVLTVAQGLKWNLL